MVAMVSIKEPLPSFLRIKSESAILIKSYRAGAINQFLVEPQGKFVPVEFSITVFLKDHGLPSRGSIAASVIPLWIIFPQHKIKTAIIPGTYNFVGYFGSRGIRTNILFIIGRTTYRIQ